MDAISHAKLFTFNNTHEAWAGFSKKVFGDLMCRTPPKHYTLMCAENNSAEIQARGRALAPDDEAQLAADQTFVYGFLIRCIADHGPEYIERIDPLSATCGTDLWNVLLDQFQNSAAVVKSRTLINLANYCMSFKGGKWSTFYAGTEKLMNLYKATNGNVINVEDMVLAMTLQGMILSGGQWQTLATMSITDETLTLDRLRARAFNHSVNYGLESEQRQIDALSTDKMAAGSQDPPQDDLRADIKQLIEALSADRPKSKKWCPVHKTDRHDKTECKVLLGSDNAGAAGGKEAGGLRCFGCGKLGHIKSACPNKPAKEYTTCQPPTEALAVNRHEQRDQPTVKTVLDSATDCHVLCDGTHATNIIKSSTHLAGVNADAPLTNLKEGDMNLGVTDVNNNKVSIAGRCLINEKQNKNLLCPAQFMDDGVVEYAVLH